MPQPRPTIPRRNKPTPQRAAKRKVEADRVSRLVLEWQKGNSDAGDEVVRGMQRIVAFWALRFWRGNPGIEYEDLLQEGRVAVWRAMRDYRKRKARFATYATIWIRAQTGAFVKKTRGPVKRYRQDMATSGTEGVSLDELRAMLDGEEPAQLIDGKAATDEAAGALEIAERVERALWELKDPRDRNVLKALFFHDRTLNEEGADRRLSRERIRQIRERALDRLCCTPTGRTLWEAA